MTYYFVGWFIGLAFGFSLRALYEKRRSPGPQCPEWTTIEIDDYHGGTRTITLRCQERDGRDGEPHAGPCGSGEGLSRTHYWEPSLPHPPRHE